MKNVKSVLGALALYFVSFVLIWLFWYWFFQKPLEWLDFMSITTSLISLLLTVGVGLGTNATFPVSTKITSYLVAFFWIVMFIVGFFVDTDDGGLNFMIYEVVDVKIPCVISILFASFIYHNP